MATLKAQAARIRWVFMLDNYKDEQKILIGTFANTHCKHELGEQGTPHLLK